MHLLNEVEGSLRVTGPGRSVLVWLRPVVFGLRLETLLVLMVGGVLTACSGSQIRRPELSRGSWQLSRRTLKKCGGANNRKPHADANRSHAAEFQRRSIHVWIRIGRVRAR